jgi:excisionase family DNA binding protein
MPSEPHPLDEPLLTAHEVSALLGGIPPKTVLPYAREGRLPCLRIGRDVRFIRSEIDRALTAQREPRRRFTRREAKNFARIAISAA